MRRFLAGVSWSVVLVGGLGCSKAVVLPTDDEARRRAEMAPPAPLNYGEPPKSTQTEPAPKRTPNRVELKGYGQ